ncbi:hypothetical protein RV14_GL000537 [Enterococcus ratti]|uniref:Uncharacterized protein n=1 Tax=Enterococcus ratti TaxID=150033 RepID=A0A1L8WIF8_9ENTE|nr:hypothetical protein RV14_GL000537 [Enterococcus ratti]
MFFSLLTLWTFSSNFARYKKFDIHVQMSKVTKSFPSLIIRSLVVVGTAAFI